MKRAITAGVAVVAMLTAGGILGRGRAEPPAVVIAPGDTLLAPGGPDGLDGIIDSLQARLAVRPDDWRGFASLGLAYLQQGRLSADPAYYPKADTALRRSLALRPEENFDAALGLGALSLGRHRFDTALEWGHRARRLNPQSAEAEGVIGDALLELGRYRAAARSYQAMIDLRPELASYARVSHYRELRGDLPGAIRAMVLALDSAGTPEDAAWTAYQLGELHLGRGEVRRAADLYRRGAALAPDAVLPVAGLA
ncbi:MAG: tetratricopeptide repeat protein, partial [Actinomycetota bacterium]